MKLIIWMSVLLLGLMTLIPIPTSAASSKPTTVAVLTKKTSAYQEEISSRKNSLKLKFGELKSRFKKKVSKWKTAIQLAFPSGKLLSSLVFLVLSIIFFAIGGLTVIAGIFNLLGSVSVILALILFVVWITERAKTAPRPAN